MSQQTGSRLPSSFSDRPRPAQSLPQPVNRRARFWRRAQRGLVGCLLLSTAVYFLANLTASWQLHRELAAVERRGEPLQLRKLAPPVLPASQNAAPVYLHAADALHLTDAEKVLVRNKPGAPTNAVMLAKNQAAMELTRQAAELPACRFPIDYDATNLAGILLPHLTRMQLLAKVMGAQAQWEARSGQTDAALNDVAVIFRMSAHIAPEPILISGVVAIAIERLGYKTLAQVLQDVSLSPAQAHAFALRLGHTDWTEMLRHDLQGERCFGLWAFQYVSNPVQASQLVNSSASAPSSNPCMKILSVLWSPLWKMDEVQYLRVINRRSEMLRKPDASLVSEDTLIQALPWYAICTRIMLPDLAQVGKKRDQVLVFRRQALAALALHAYRTSQGHYPPDLHTAETAWGSALPHDLSTDQPFLYKTDGETLSLSRVEPNRKAEDDKKAEATRAEDVSTDSGDDLTW